MTDLVTDDTDLEPASDGGQPDARPGLRRSLAAVIVVALLVVAVAAGYFWGNRTGDDSAATPTSSSVDAGFARDMAVHHRQAVTMAEYTLARTTNSAVSLLAFDIDATQSVQLGEMQGWLDSWNLDPVSAHPMSWMGAHMASMVTPSGLMPGMATPTQMSQLQSATGTKLDVLFLQLMIHHHQGGVAMAQYAAAHANESYVKLLAQKMVNLQTSEITQMEQLLRQLGGSPLPPPAS